MCIWPYRPSPRSLFDHIFSLPGNRTISETFWSLYKKKQKWWTRSAKKSLKHWSHYCKKKHCTQCQYIRYHKWTEHTRGKWMRGYGTKLVWNSVRSTFRAPSNLKDAVMLQEKKKTHKYNYNDKAQWQPHLIKVWSGKKLMHRTIFNWKMQSGFMWII